MTIDYIGHCLIKIGFNCGLFNMRLSFDIRAAEMTHNGLSSAIDGLHLIRCLYKSDVGCLIWSAQVYFMTRRNIDTIVFFPFMGYSVIRSVCCRFSVSLVSWNALLIFL